MKLLLEYRRVWRGVQREAKLYLLTTVIYWLGMTLVQLYLNFFLQSLGLDQGWIGLINAAPNITIVVMTLVIGSVSRRIGPWLAIVCGMALAGGSVFLTAAGTSAWVVLAGSMLGGLGGGFVFSNGGPFLMLHSEERSRATVFSMQAAMGTLTGFVAYLGGGALPRLFSGMLDTPETGATVMRWVLVVAGVLYMLAVLPMLAARSARHAHAVAIDGSQGQPAGARSRRLLGSDPGLMLKLLVPGALVSLGAGMTIPFMNIYIERKFDVDFSQLGQLFAWTAVATAVALLLQPVLADRVGKVKSVVLVQAGSLPFLLVLGYADFFPLVAVALFVRAALMNMGNPVFSAYSLGRIETSDRATYSSMSSSTWSLGWAIGSWFSGALREAIGFFEGFGILFGLMAAFYLSSTVVMWLMFGREEERELRAAASIREESAVAA